MIPIQPPPFAIPSREMGVIFWRKIGFFMVILFASNLLTWAVSRRSPPAIREKPQESVSKPVEPAIELPKIERPPLRTNPLTHQQCLPLFFDSLAAYDRQYYKMLHEPILSQQTASALLVAQDDLYYAIASQMIYQSDGFRGWALANLAPKQSAEAALARDYLHSHHELLIVPHAGDCRTGIGVGKVYALTGNVRVLEVAEDRMHARIRLDYDNRFTDWNIRYDLASTLHAGQLWPYAYDSKLMPIIVPLSPIARGKSGEAFVVSDLHYLHNALAAMGRTEILFASEDVFGDRHFDLARTILTPQKLASGALDRNALIFSGWPIEK